VADVERTLAGTTTGPWQEAMKAYSNSEYARAFQLLSHIPEDGLSYKYYLYMGIIAMELGDYSHAIELFSELDDDIVLRHEGMWYTSLCYLGLEDLKSTRRALNDIIVSNGHYETIASALLKKL
jgi:tetratricopeptide (TPR) repeat protein